ncbi:right-handed parallel beta-helix repeat-containing protein [Paenibacillus sp.]|uniref:right-handed parallel beta-helix repeat-containing protein n=1 Tax=Paenibacillus sp. TaxID=58172 RepID=UPI002D28E846|nr:right-handed parallel beta-helix repeat-containing protein [Paenibacillus sp.]HZG56010.1 right-handed parallel beta-helix repeat-containing protein [Paenibacillus sp.]
MTIYQGNVYYVAVDGDDRNDGREVGGPLRTIQEAARRMKPGDTCFIREGTYRETVAPARSGTEEAPIRFAAYGNERVVVSGCDPVAEWTHWRGGIYKGKMGWSMAEGNGNLVFFDGELGTEAQWPNMTDRLDRSQYARVDAAENGYPYSTIFDEDLLAFPDGYWTGAMVACVNGVGYFMSTAKVVDFRAGTLYFDQWVSSAEHYHTRPGDLYFLTRTAKALDAAREWHYDAEEGALYAVLPEGGAPEAHLVEAKRREYAFDLSGRTDVHLVGLRFRGASVALRDASRCVVDGCSFTGLDRYFGYRQSIYGRTKGLELGGRDNVLRGCEISHFEGIGVNVSGERNAVVNCYIHDGNFEASYASLIWMTGSGHTVSRSTVTRGGRTAVSGVFARSVIEYCDISFANALTKDSGMIYLFNHDFDNTQIHHNWLHDNLADHLSFGFYMDAWTSGVSFFRNVVWNIPDRGMVLNRPIHRTLIYNNTFYRRAVADSSVFCLDDMYGTHLANNLFADGEVRRWGEHSEASHNRFDAASWFVDAEGGDFRLRPGAPAIGAGRPLRGVTDEQAGGAPDVGAYDFGGEAWVPGHDFARPPASPGGFVALDHASRLANGGFERGEWAPWTVAKGTPELVFECAWDYSRNGYASVVRSNKYAAALRAGDAIEQIVEGLEPNTTYIFYAGIKSGGAYLPATSHAERAGGPWDRGADGEWPIYRDVPYVGPLQAGEWLRFAAVDFGAPGTYDSLSVGLNKAFGPVAIEARLDAPDGPRIGAVSLACDYDGTWRYFGANLASVGGVHDVYFVLSGPGRCLAQSFVLHHSAKAGTARMSVRGHGGAEASKLVNRWNWESTLSELRFTTGPEATSAIVSIENAGGLAVVGWVGQNIYVDDCGVWAPPATRGERT